MTIQLNPPIEVITPKGHAWALLHIDYGAGLNGVFLVAHDEDGSMLYVQVTDCRAAENFAFNLPRKSLTVQVPSANLLA